MRLRFGCIIHCGARCIGAPKSRTTQETGVAAAEPLRTPNQVANITTTKQNIYNVHANSKFMNTIKRTTVWANRTDGFKNWRGGTYNKKNAWTYKCIYGRKLYSLYLYDIHLVYNLTKWKMVCDIASFSWCFVYREEGLLQSLIFK